MDAHGAIVMDPRTGELERAPGFVLDTARVGDVGVRRHRYALDGTPTTGWFATIDDTTRVGPFPSPDRAAWYARVYAGVMERAA